MPLYAIPFPAFDPVLISFGPIAIRWYALAYIVGILLGWLYARTIISTSLGGSRGWNIGRTIGSTGGRSATGGGST